MENLPTYAQSLVAKELRQRESAVLPGSDLEDPEMDEFSTLIEERMSRGRTEQVFNYFMRHPRQFNVLSRSTQNHILVQLSDEGANCLYEKIGLIAPAYIVDLEQLEEIDYEEIPTDSDDEEFDPIPEESPADYTTISEPANRVLPGLEALIRLSVRMNKRTQGYSPNRMISPHAHRITKKLLTLAQPITAATEMKEIYKVAFPPHIRELLI